MLGIHQHNSYHLAWVEAREDADVIPTERVSHQDVGALFTRAIQERAKFLRDL
jgi:hypothetical protein